MYMLNKPSLFSVDLLETPAFIVSAVLRQKKILQWSSLPTAIGFGAGCTLCFFSF